MTYFPPEGIPIDPHEGPMTYIVTLKSHDDLPQFYTQMETATTNLSFIPDRIITCVERMPISRNTSYSLEQSEALTLLNDPRVLSVSLPWEIRGIEPNLYGWSSSSSTIGVDFNQTTDQTPWGLYRVRTKDDIQMGKPYSANLSVAGTRTVSHELSGKNVDVIIVDGENFDPQNLEFRTNSDGTGASRVICTNWLEYDAQVTGGKMPWSPTSRYFHIWNQHQAHTAGTTAGNTVGLARDADIYMLPYNQTYSYGVNSSYSSDLLPYQYIKQWHLNKKVNPFTGRKNPTITNSSWGFSYPYNSTGFYLAWSTKIVYRGGAGVAGGEDILPISGDPTQGTAKYSTADLDRVGFISKVRMPVRDPATDADIIDLAAVGVINVVSAGNSSWYCDVPNGPDYNNYFLQYKTVTITLTGNVTFDGTQQVIWQPNNSSTFKPAVVITTLGTTNVIVGTGWLYNCFFDNVNPIYKYPFSDEAHSYGPNSIPISSVIGGLTPIYYHRGSSPGASYQGDLSPICVGAMGATNPGFLHTPEFSDITNGHYGKSPLSQSLAYGNYKSEFSNYGPRIDVYAPGALTTSINSVDMNNYNSPAGPVGASAYYNTAKFLGDNREKNLDPTKEDVGNTVAWGTSTGDPYKNQYSRNIKVSIAGTSMSGPHVTGVLACMLERYPNWTQKDARAWIANNAVESMLTTNGGPSDVTDLGLTRNQNSNKKMLYFPSNRFLDDTPNSTPTNQFKTSSYPLSNYSTRNNTNSQWPRSNYSRIQKSIIPSDATVILSANQTEFTEIDYDSAGKLTNFVTFYIETTKIPNGTKIPYSITNRSYNNTFYLGGFSTVDATWPLADYQGGGTVYPSTLNGYITINNNSATLTKWIHPIYHGGPTQTEYPRAWGFQFRIIAPGNPYVNIKVNTIPNV